MDTRSSAEKSRFVDRYFDRLLVAPSIFILLLVAIFPLIYLVLVSFQGITMTENSNDFIGLENYRNLLTDTRLWASMGHTLLFLLIALPLELLLGLFMAQLFLEKLPGRQIFIALLVLPVVI